MPQSQPSPFYEFLPTITTFLPIFLMIILARCFVSPLDDRTSQSELEDSLLNSEKFLSLKRSEAGSGEEIEIAKWVLVDEKNRRFFIDCYSGWWSESDHDFIYFYYWLKILSYRNFA